MLRIFEKIYKPIPKLRPKQEVNEERPLIVELNKLLQCEDFATVFLSPVNSLWIINTYTDSFAELAYSLYKDQFHRDIIAVNLNSYFLRSRRDLDGEIRRVIAHIPKVPKLSPLIEHDLYEICSAFHQLVDMEKANVSRSV